MKGIYILLSILMMTTPNETDKHRPYYDEENMTAKEYEEQIEKDNQSGYDYLMDLINK